MQRLQDIGTATARVELATRSAVADHATVVARVQCSRRATDLAMRSGSGILTAVRCVDRPRSSDHSALTTMIEQGDFVWAAIVHGACDAPRSDGPIECFSVNQLDELAARLLALRGSSHEPG